jgi:RNA polymerase sigma-70 factor (ECF subfamily)
VVARGGAADGRANRRLGEVYDEYLAVAYGYARARLQEADAEDVTAEVFRSLAERLHDDPDLEISRAFVLAATRNRIIDRWRRDGRWRRRLHALGVVEPIGTGCGDLGDRVIEALDRLAPDHRLALVLRYVDQYKIAEIAEIVGKSEHAVESLIVRARRSLLTEFEQVEP